MEEEEKEVEKEQAPDLQKLLTEANSSFDSILRDIWTKAEDNMKKLEEYYYRKKRL